MAYHYADKLIILPHLNLRFSPVKLTLPTCTFIISGSNVLLCKYLLGRNESSDLHQVIQYKSLMLSDKHHLLVLHVH